MKREKNCWCKPTARKMRKPYRPALNWWPFMGMLVIIGYFALKAFGTI